MTLLRKTSILCILAFLTSCKCSPEPAVSFDTADEARGTVRENLTFNANNYRSQNARYVEYSIYLRGDSTQSQDCPQGDGWASIDLQPKEPNGPPVKLKCSTVSANLGCMVDSDFKSKSYANEDGVCNPKIPFPIKKLVK